MSTKTFSEQAKPVHGGQTALTEQKPFFGERDGQTSDASFFQKSRFAWGKTQSATGASLQKKGIYSSVATGTKTKKFDSELEQLKKIISDLALLLRLEKNIYPDNIKAIKGQYLMIKDIVVENQVRGFKENNKKIKEKLGSKFEYKDDVAEVDKAIMVDNINLAATKKDAEDYIALYDYYKNHIDYDSIYDNLNYKTLAVENPAFFPFGDADFDFAMKQWQGNTSSFSAKFASASNRINRFFSVKNEAILNYNIKELEAFWLPNKDRKKTKDNFDMKKNTLGSEAKQADADPEAKNEKGNIIGYQGNYSKLYRKQLGDKTKISAADVVQGRFGDCYYLAAIAAIAKISPDYFTSVIEEPVESASRFEKRRFIVTLYFKSENGSYEPHKINVDNDFPAENGMFISAAADTRELWVMLLEKALAKYFGSYKSIERGSPAFGLSVLTGNSAETIMLSGITSYAGLVQRLPVNHASRPVIFSSKSTPLDSKIVSKHAYFLQGVNDEGKTISLQNPQGSNHLPDISISTILDNFESIHIGSISEKKEGSGVPANQSVPITK